MGHLIAGEITKSRVSKNVETIRARPGHYIEWCLANHTQDPVGREPGWQCVLAVCIEYVMTGVTCLNWASLRSATCKGHALDTSRLFILRNFPSPVDLSDETNWTRTIVHNLEREENIASQRKPLDDRIHAESIKQAAKVDKDSLEAVVADIVSSGKATGWRASEHSQTKQDKVDYHE